mmetsp:Transcript_24177/g.65476  ORF Transcript_24177/g.65476 Transcript_24177/m.65476 type:complete len:220 (-) Transcript_24177:254-913(-)
MWTRSGSASCSACCAALILEHCGCRQDEIAAARWKNTICHGHLQEAARNLVGAHPRKDHALLRELALRPQQHAHHRWELGLSLLRLGRQDGSIELTRGFVALGHVQEVSHRARGKILEGQQCHGALNILEIGRARLSSGGEVLLCEEERVLNSPIADNLDQLLLEEVEGEMFISSQEPRVELIHAIHCGLNVPRLYRCANSHTIGNAVEIHVRRDSGFS